MDEEADDVFEKEEFQPQVSYCCGNKGNVLSSSFKHARVRSTFVIQVFSFKLLQMTFVSGIIFLAVQWNPFHEIVHEFHWVMFIALGILVVFYSSSRFAGAGRKYPTNFFMFLIDTIALSCFCCGLTTLSWFPYPYFILVVAAFVSLLFFGALLMAVLFDVDVSGKGMYRALFGYFLLLSVFAQVAYLGNIGPRYQIPYITFLQYGGVGGIVALVITMIVFWRVQELIAGNTVSLTEKEYIFVTLIV